MHENAKINSEPFWTPHLRRRIIPQIIVPSRNRQIFFKYCDYCRFFVEVPPIFSCLRGY